MAKHGSRGNPRGGKYSNRESGHKEPGFSGSKGSRSRTSGSHAHIGERMGAGEVAGAGETMGFDGGGIGKRVHGSSSADFPSTKTPGAEKGVQNHTRGMENDD